MENFETTNFVSDNENIFNEIFKDGLLNKFKVEKVESHTYWDLYFSEFYEQYPDEIIFNHELLMAKEQSKKYAENTIPLQISNYLIVKDNDKVIALFRSEQKDNSTYYMRHAIVHMDYRRKGIYTDYLKKIIEYSNRLGFLQIVSCFVAANNIIHRAKIKEDFFVTSIEIHPEYGSLVWLSYFLNNELKNAFSFRSGMVQFTKKMYYSSEGTAKILLDKLDKIAYN